jgi:hypothetical protein
MEDLELEISNLRVRITMLHRQEHYWLEIIADNSKSADEHNAAREELRKVIKEILSDAGAIRKLESRL